MMNRVKDEGGTLRVKDESLSAFRLPPSSFEVLSSGIKSLANTDSPRLTAEVLLAHVLGINRTQLLSHPERPVSPEAFAEFEPLLARAATGEPLAYLTGHREFYGLDFLVDSRVLVPRPETELLIDLALSPFQPLSSSRSFTLSPCHPVTLSSTPSSILDIGTGSGCIAIALAIRLPSAHLTAVDISSDALALARLNAQHHSVADHITFLESDLLSSMPPSFFTRSGHSSREAAIHPSSFILHPSSFALLTANLPYIASDELRHLSVSKHEPTLALDGGLDGLGLIRRLLADAPRVMAPNGRLLLEIGATQGEAVIAIARAAFPTAEAVGVHPDLAGLDRVVEIRF